MESHGIPIGTARSKRWFIEKGDMTAEIREGAQQICTLLKTGEPFLVGRNGTIELEVLFFWLIRRKDGGRQPYTAHHMDALSINAGIFPRTEESIDAWCEAYCAAIEEMNGLAAGWYKPLQHIESAILKFYTSGSEFRCPLRSLEPYYVEPEVQWTRFLAGKRVAVVSSFANTIQRQIEGGKIWVGVNEGLLPSGVAWSYVRTGYSPALAMGRAGWPSNISSWQDAVAYVVEAVVEADADVAILGCGGLGVVIGAELKRKGISAIILGGAVQVLFGIKGARWAKHPIISTFWNEAWVSPSENETPKGASLVEGGCYW